MDKIKVACAQFKPDIGMVDSNIDKITSCFSRTCQLKSPDIIVFPELCIQGITSMEETIQTAETIPGNATNRICELCKNFNVYSVVGMAEKKGNNYYNSAVLISPEGKIIGVYHKVHLWDKEAEYFMRGSEYPVFDTDFGKVAMWVCYDTRFPEVARSYALKSARIAFVPTAWLERDVEHWKLLIRGRALENFLSICGADLIIQTELFRASGSSMIIDHSGKIAALAEPMTECIISEEIDLQKTDEMRKLIPILRDRQTHTYKGLIL